jgi:glyoxylase-like metal-dependent hydrolase (beta-lactamase superfamily II)
MPTSDVPERRDAVLHVLQTGYATVRDDFDYPAAGDAHIGPSIGLVLDGDQAIVIDPGFVADRDAFIASVHATGVSPTEITDVVFSHHHPDHTVNAALFPAARIHDHWAIYRNDLWHAREADGSLVSPSVRLIRTPGHTPEDITTLVGTSMDLVAFTHAWPTDEQPDDGRSAPDPTFVLASRRRIVAAATLVIPGHGPGFRPKEM